MPQMTKKEIIEKLKTIKGVELKMDFTIYHSGSVVDGFVAQADITKGLTIRGAEPFNNPDQDGDDVDLYCLNIEFIGAQFDQYSEYTYENYLHQFQQIIEGIEAGVYVIPDASSGGTSCAF